MGTISRYLWKERKLQLVVLVFLFLLLHRYNPFPAEDNGQTMPLLASSFVPLVLLGLSISRLEWSSPRKRGGIVPLPPQIPQLDEP